MNRYFLFILCLLTAPSLKAEPVIPLPVETLTAKAQLVLRGTVESKTVQRDPEGRIYTKIDLKVNEIWKGTLSTNHFTIVHSGGILGEEHATTSGQVQYEIGEELVAFLVLNQRGEGVTLGLSQGKFHVWADPATGEKLTHNRFHGWPENSTDSDKPGKSRLTVTTLKQRVTEAAR